MNRKPDSCKQCKMYGDGEGFVPDEVLPGSSVFVMLQNPGVDEETEARPAVGKAGQYMNTDLIPMAGLQRGSDVSVGNIFKCRWQHSNDLPSVTGVIDAKGKLSKKAGKQVEEEAAQFCLDQHTVIPKSTKIIVAAGDVPFNTLSPEEGGVTECRGFISPTQYKGLPVFATYHPSFLIRPGGKRMNIPAMNDWQRVRKYLDKTWPLPIPKRDVMLAPREHIPEGTRFVTIDTEFSEATYQIWLLGIAYWGVGPHPICGDQILSHEWDYGKTHNRLLKLISSVPVVGQNVLAEMLAFSRSFEIEPCQFLKYEDIMQLHAVLHCEWPHDLGFIESMHGRHKRLKGLSDENALLYNWGDCLTPGYAFKDMMRIEKKDPLSFRVYREQNIPLIPIRYESKKVGLRLNRVFLSELSHDLAHRIQYAQDVAEGYTGTSINLGSHLQFTQWLQEVEGIEIKKKHGTLKVDKDSVAELRREFYDFDPDEEKDGITPAILDANIDAGGHPLLEARAAFQNANQLFTHFVAPLTVELGRLPGCRGFDPGEFVTRVYPDQHTHTQASGRWSTVGPPLATLPEKLRKMIIPDEGQVIIGYDADMQELRIASHMAHDEPTIGAIFWGHDIHTLNTCDVFGFPYPEDKRRPHDSEVCKAWRASIGWEGKGDKRRVFAKRFVFRLLYRGDPRGAGDIPGAKALGLTRKTLVEASRNYLGKHPAWAPYWEKLDAKIKATRVTRSFRGRKRFLNGAVTAPFGGVPQACREGTNHPIQSGGVDWCNLTILHHYRESHNDLGIIWGYGAHDSHKWLVPAQHEKTFRERVGAFSDVPWTVDGRELFLPVTLDPTTYPPKEVSSEC